MNSAGYSRLKFGVALGTGALIALLLCVQSVRTFLYIGGVLIPQQAEREAERQGGLLSSSARMVGIGDPKGLTPVVQHALDASSDRLVWIRIYDASNAVIAQAGKPQASLPLSPAAWHGLERHESKVRLVDTQQGKAFVVVVPFRMPRPSFHSEAHFGRPGVPAVSNAAGESVTADRPPAEHRPPVYAAELAIPVSIVAQSFEGLRNNLIVGVIAALALLAALTIIALRTPGYFRGKYLERELHVAKRVQRDLQPRATVASRHVEFGAAMVAADHVGGDYYDVFEDSGKISIVLGDVSGKGMSAALLVNVLQGAIRSSTVENHELACGQINRMLCERSACERFATLFWAVFEPDTSTLRYVNAGHSSPMLLRAADGTVERLSEGGPVLGVLSNAIYVSGVISVEPGDVLILYSDGINEAASREEEEFGDDRIRELLSGMAHLPAAGLCDGIMRRVSAFSDGGPAPDDRTLLAVRFTGAAVPHTQQDCAPVGIPAAA